MIKPQVSMPVLYHPAPDDHYAQHGRPMAAVIARVWSDSMVNLAIFDDNGQTWHKTSVTLHQGGGNTNELYGVNGRFCEFPEWLWKLMVPQPFFVFSHSELTPADFGCQPTSQVLG